ncbi:MAG: DUF971 domain-containing protein [Candidatus Sericytochromatia bacterium]
MRSFTRDEITPVGMLPKNNGLVIQWADNTDLEYDFRGLRLACPCAMCIDENTGEKILVASMVPVDIKALTIESVGNYAIRFVWSDGHKTGIYPFPLLRTVGEARREMIAAQQSRN